MSTEPHSLEERVAEAIRRGLRAADHEGHKAADNAAIVYGAARAVVAELGLTQDESIPRGTFVRYVSPWHSAS